MEMKLKDKPWILKTEDDENPRQNFAETKEAADSRQS